MFSRKSIDNFSFPHNGLGAVRTSVYVVVAKLTFFVQTRCCSYKVDVRTKCEHYSYKVVEVLWAKLTLFLQSMVVVFTKVCTRK